MTISEMKEIVEKAYSYPGLCTGLDDEAVQFYFKAIEPTGNDLWDADAWAWLNTLIGYEISYDDYLEIADWWANDTSLSVMEVMHYNRKEIEEAIKDKHLNIDMSGWATEEPKAIRFDWFVA